MINRAGSYQKQAGGYMVFLPAPLPPDPRIVFNDELHVLLSGADQSIARLDGIAGVMPNLDLFIGMYVKKEALLSSQIEGTQASLEGVLEFEANMTPKDDINQIKEVINYIKALNHGQKLLDQMPISVVLTKKIHETLIGGTRGRNKTPGEFRKIQNWIGPPGCSLVEAKFVPPPPENVAAAMQELENFMLKDDPMPQLLKIALIHAQFETIHPFRDGNGRVGRLLITLYLLWKRILSKPLLYLSFYLKKNRERYYSQLMKIRTEGDWEGWIAFFLEGIKETSEESILTAKNIINLKDSLIEKLYENAISSIHAVKLIDFLFERPVIAVNDVIERFRLSKDTATELVNRFEKAQIIKEITGKKRYRKYIFKDYVDIIARGTEIE